MKKIILLFTFVILFTACSVKEIKKEDIDKLIDDTLQVNVKSTNNSFKGYKFFTPRGFVIQSKKDNNYVLLSNNEKYYLYIDIVSYFHKEKNKTEFDNNLYFSKEISYNDIDGYIKIRKSDNDLYNIEMLYNYSKIETFVKEQNLEYAIKNSLKILSSIEYNDIILDTMIGEKTLDYEEEVYNFFESKREEGNFLDYIEEYDAYEKQENIKDEDILDSIEE